MQPIGKVTLLTDQNWSHRAPSITKSPVRASDIKKLESEIKVSGIALKYVVDGCELYQTGSDRLILNTNHYLIAYEKSDCFVSIDHRASSKGVCIDLSRQYLEEIIHTYTRINEFDESESIHSFFMEDILSGQSHNASPILRNYLRQIFAHSQDHDNAIIATDIVRDVAMAFIEDHLDSVRHYCGIQAIKSTTRKENYRRIKVVRDLINQNASLPEIDLAKIAREACLSEFRMYHLFQQSFKSSPYQYFLRLRIDKAIECKRMNQQQSWTNIAHQLGFGDLPTFSKIFKKVKGVAPTNYEPVEA